MQVRLLDPRLDSQEHATGHDSAKMYAEISTVSYGCHVFAIKSNPGILRCAVRLLGQCHCTTVILLRYSTGGSTRLLESENPPSFRRACFLGTCLRLRDYHRSGIPDFPILVFYRGCFISYSFSVGNSRASIGRNLQ